MAYTISTVSITLLCLALTSCVYLCRSKIPKGLRLPPGPPRKPILGNLTDLLSDDKPEYVTYAELARKYGDLVYLNVFGTSILLVNSYEMVHELLEKRGSIYSDRAVTTMLHDLTSLGNSLLVTRSYSDKVTRQRAIIHDLMSVKKMPKHWNLLEAVAKTFMCDLYSDADNLRSHIRHALGALIMEVSYGIKIRSKDDPFVELAEKTLKCLSKTAMPGAYMVDFLPILKYLPSWFPGLKFPAAAAELERLYQDMTNRPFEAAGELFKSGQAKPSLVTNYFERLQIDPSSVVDKENIQQVATVMYLGGIDTTEVALQSFFLAMAIHPDVQRKAQEELDRVVGQDNLPSLRNQEDLPYVNAICKEIQRWHPVGPVGVPRRLKQDDIIGEYFIPKDTLVFGNIRALLRSTKVYGLDADKFRPERFLEETLGFPDVAFGFGRRVCSGKHFAEAGIFIMVACTLHMFNISAYDDKEIRDIYEHDLFDKGLISRPSGPFRCRLGIRPGLEKTMQQILIR